jgi:hypothetical protein
MTEFEELLPVRVTSFFSTEISSFATVVDPPEYSLLALVVSTFSVTILKKEDEKSIALLEKVGK